MLIAIAIAEEIQGLQRIAKSSASFDLLCFLWFWQEIFRKLGNSLPKSRKTQKLKTCRTSQSKILGSLLQCSIKGVQFRFAMMMMIIFLYCNQRLLFEFYFNIWRVLSIRSDPYQALMKSNTKHNKENYRK